MTNRPAWIRAAIDYACPAAFLGALLITRNFQLATWCW